MGLEQVKKEISSNAKNQERKIINEAETKAKETLKKADEKIKEKKSEFNKHTKALVESIEKKELSTAMLESKKIILKKKKEIIDKVISKLNNSISKLNSKDIHALFGHALKKASKSLAVSKIYCNNQTGKIIKKATKHKIIVDNGVGNGFVFEDKEGNVRLDYTFKSIIENLKDKELQRLSKILF